MFSRDLITSAGLYGGIFPIGIIDLQLHEFHFGVSSQNRFQFLRRGMERKTDMLDESFALLFPYPRPKVKIVEIMRTAFPEVVEQIKIEISRSRSF